MSDRPVSDRTLGQPGEPVAARTDPEPIPPHAWPALWALVLGFFMILVDSTIVSVATPALMSDLHADINSVMWVTSAYLLAYAVPLLITGRLGDRFGPKWVYLVGLTIFTLSSLWCGLTNSIGTLVVARVVQGLGASLMTPQTMAVITRTFPARHRGQAMALWGATAGVATLVGPILGGVLIDHLGWEWIFFINVPVGIIGFVLAWRLVPTLEIHSHEFDMIGVVLSAVGLFCAVFGIQEGETYNWGQISGIISVPLLIGVGVVLLGVFIWWQSRIRREPLVPLVLFRDRNFSLANLAVVTVGFAYTAMVFPFMIYAQAVRGLTPTGAALLMAPQAIMSILLARPVGLLVDRVHPRLIAGFGLLTMAVALWGTSEVMTTTSDTWQILAFATLMGVGGSCIWAPLSTSANRNLPMRMAGAGAGVYNTTRQMGSVLGSAAIAVFMEIRLTANLPGMNAAAPQMGGGGSMPPFIAEAFARSLAQAMLLPAAVLLIGFVAALLFEKPHHMRVDPATATVTAARPAPG